MSSCPLVPGLISHCSLALPLFSLLCLLPVQHRGNLERLQGGRQQLLTVSCARIIQLPKTVCVLEMRCWGLEQESEQTPLAEISISFCLSSVLCEDMCLCLCDRPKRPERPCTRCLLELPLLKCLLAFTFI